MPPGMPLGPKPGTLAPGLNPEGPKLGGVAPAGKGGGRSGLGCGGVKKEGLPPAVGRVAPKAGLLPLGSGGAGRNGRREPHSHRELVELPGLGLDHLGSPQPQESGREREGCRERPPPAGAGHRGPPRGLRPAGRHRRRRRPGAAWPPPPPWRAPPGAAGRISDSESRLLKKGSTLGPWEGRKPGSPAAPPRRGSSRGRSHAPGNRPGIRPPPGGWEPPCRPRSARQRGAHLRHREQLARFPRPLTPRGPGAPTSGGGAARGSPPASGEGRARGGGVDGTPTSNQFQVVVPSPKSRHQIGPPFSPSARRRED